VNKIANLAGIFNYKILNISAFYFSIQGGAYMLKIRLQGTKNDIRWFVRLLQRDKRFEVNNVSTFFDNVGTDKYKRVYAEVSRKKKDSGKKPSDVMQVEEKCHYIGSGMVIR
jgi:hypothetical protein